MLQQERICNRADDLRRWRMRNLPLVRTEAEFLVDLLEEKEEGWRISMAAEVRELFGMCKRAAAGSSKFVEVLHSSGPSACGKPAILVREGVGASHAIQASDFRHLDGSEAMPMEVIRCEACGATGGRFTIGDGGRVILEN